MLNGVKVICCIPFLLIIFLVVIPASILYYLSMSMFVFASFMGDFVESIAETGHED